MSPWEGPRQGRHSEEGPHGPYFNKIITFRAQGAKKPSALSASLFHTFHFSFIHSQAHTLCLLFSLSLSLTFPFFLFLHPFTRFTVKYKSTMPTLSPKLALSCCSKALGSRHTVHFVSVLWPR